MTKINYSPKCYETGKQQGNYRFALEQPGSRMLFVVGLNPSTANEKHPDPTMRKVIGFAERNNYDGFVMLNLSAERATDKHKLRQERDDSKHKDNLKNISEISARYPDADILVAYGNSITLKPYLQSCFQDIVSVFKESKGRWLKIGNLTVKGHPRHPLYARYDWGLTDFNIVDYLNK